MKRDDESAARIEARLERSLRRQVTAPKLDGRFDAAVWSRIGEEGRAAARNAQVSKPLAKTSAMPRWLLVCNVLGVAVTAILVIWYGARQVSGIDLGLDLGVEWPTLSLDTQQSLLYWAGQILAIAAVLFGLMFTRVGRRLLSALR
jgi:hypothetical protein